MIISNDTSLDLKEDLQLQIRADGPLTLKLKAQNDANVFIRLIKAEKLKIQTEIISSCKVTIFFWNESKDILTSEEEYTVDQQADLTLGYGECNLADSKRNISVHLSGRKARALVSSACLADTKKDFNIEVINENTDTEGQIRNFAVVLGNGDLMIDAVGKIINGAHRSRSHQVSRALSFEEGQKAVILPELLIDENDVQASHAMSIGRADEDQLYYMMSRGLNMKECTTLLSLGYLLPISDLISDAQMRQQIKTELENRINEICLM